MSRLFQRCGPLPFDRRIFAGPAITESPTQAPPPGDQAPADAEARRERQQAILSDLAEAGLEIALALKARIVETATEPGPESARACADLTRAFDRASRATRMAIALSERLLKEAPLGAQSSGTRAGEGRDQRAGRVLRIFRRVAHVQFPEGRLREAVDHVARERLFDPDITGDLLGRPIGALVAQICADLCLSPSWRALAEEAWARDEILERPAGSPYAAWPDLPPEEPDPDDLDLDDPDLDELDGDIEDEDEDDADGLGGSDP